MVGQMILEDGDIINIRYLRERGLDALKRIFETDHFNNLTFLEKNKAAIRSQNDMTIPPRSQLLDILRRLTKSDAPAPARTRPQPVQKRVGNPSQLINIVAAELAIYIGPMAMIVCQQQVWGDSADILKSLDKVASLVEDAHKANQFKRTVKEKIEALM